ncbi:MAG: tetratricopeptide repeat protein [Rhodocyclaceae bacterium]|nr:tetratricopeptide repeat protein [Rhodocyclaceae bacterium]
MSLLMEALKKAEAAKRRSQTEPSLPEDGTTLELAPLGAFPPAAAEPPPPAATSLPALPSDLEILDAEFLHSAPPPRRIEKSPPAPEIKSATVEPQKIPVPEIPYEPREMRGIPPQPFQPRATAPKPEAKASEQEAVQNLFDAKHTAAPVRKNLIVAIGLFSLIAAVGIGIYFWLQLQPKSSLTLAARNAPLRQTIAQPQPPPPVAALPVVEPQPETEEPEQADAKPAKQTTVVVEPAPAPAVPIRVTTTKFKLDPALDKGYNALQQGDWATALSAYEAALKNDSANIDALHGMAVVNLRLGKSAEADLYFQRALESDPKDSLAIAGLANLRGQSSSAQTESRLKGILADQPSNAAVNFALGNLYAQQNRWGDAQQAYFRAMDGDPENSDFLFNLAVALDHLHQVKPAAQYYARALDAAKKRPGGFDPAQASERLKKLQP